MGWPLEDQHWTFLSRLDRVIDGDTYDLRLDLGFRTYVKKRVRMVGIDTAEIYFVSSDSEEYKKGIEQKEYVQEWFRMVPKIKNSDFPLLVSTAKDTGKYGRWPALIRSRKEHPSGLALRKLIVEEYPNVEKNNA